MKKIAVYSTHPFEKPYLIQANEARFELIFIEEALSLTTVSFAAGCKTVAIFTSDDASAIVLSQLKKQGTEFIVARSAGYDHIDLAAAAKLDIKAANVPEYSPHAIAEHSIAMMLALSRHLIQASEQIKKYDFNIEQLTGFNLHNKTVGIIGTGRIGSVACKILHGFGCKLLGYDIERNEALVTAYGLNYVSLEELCTRSDIISLYAPLNEQTTDLINKESIKLMKQGVMLINTARGKLVDTPAVLAALKSGKIGYLGLDVYEKEKGIFFHDHSAKGIEDEDLKTLISSCNVLVTAHQAFLTKEALKNIADTTLYNIDSFINGKPAINLLTAVPL